jgi:hypothetical protein
MIIGVVPWRGHRLRVTCPSRGVRFWAGPHRFSAQCGPIRARDALRKASRKIAEAASVAPTHRQCRSVSVCTCRSTCVSTERRQTNPQPRGESSCWMDGRAPCAFWRTAAACLRPVSRSRRRPALRLRTHADAAWPHTNRRSQCQGSFLPTTDPRLHNHYCVLRPGLCVWPGLSEPQPPRRRFPWTGNPLPRIQRHTGASRPPTVAGRSPSNPTPPRPVQPPPSIPNTDRTG